MTYFIEKDGELCDPLMDAINESLEFTEGRSACCDAPVTETGFCDNCGENV